MNFVFLMDPLHTVIMAKDTSFILMLSAHKKGHNVYYLPSGGMTLKNGSLLFHVIKVTPQKNKQNPFIEERSETLPANEIDVVFIRTDPPFDEEYLINTWLLDLLPQKVTVINDPQGIRTTNEKIWATQFASLVPPTLISRNKADLLEFVYEVKEVVAKPTNQYGGKSVFIVKAGELNTPVILETLTNSWNHDIILQKYVDEAHKGDKRILLLDGEPLGAVLRLHAEDDHRNNFFSGGKAVETSISKRDIEIVETLKPKLKQLGLFFVGIDVIGEHLIEVNVTSPTCLQEASRYAKEPLEDRVIEFAEHRVKSNK